MRKIQIIIKKFLLNHYLLGYIITLIIFLSSAICVVNSYSEFEFIAGILGISSFATLLRLTLYKSGKIPFFMRDTSWRCRNLDEYEEYQKNIKKNLWNERQPISC